MIQKIKGYLLLAASAIMLVAPTAVVATVSTVSADQVCGSGTIGESLSEGANGAALGGQQHGTCQDPSSVNNTGLSNLGHKIVNTFSLVIGIVAIIMIIYGGFRYITSGGASERVGSAKNTLIYAIIGLIIVALAQIIVHFVLNQTNSAVTGSQ